jgi:competence protein ComEC
MSPDPAAARRGPLRLPKLAPAALAAMAGIALAEWIPALAPPVWCGALALAVFWFGAGSRRGVLLLAVAAAFGLAHALAPAGKRLFPLAALPADGRPAEVTAVGVVAEAPVRDGGGVRFPLHLESIVTADGSWSLRTRVMTRWWAPVGGAIVPPACGDRVEIAGLMAAPAEPRNPGQFDVATWLERQGIVAELRIRQLRTVERRAGLPVKRFAVRVRDGLATAIASDLADRPAEAAVIKAMVLGAREDMAAEVDDAFLLSGTLHIFSVSGLHVGLVAVILWRVLNLLRLSRRQAAWASIPLVFSYALVTGWQPAAVRSALMAAVVLLGVCLNRPAAFFNSLCLAALVILAGDTQQLFMAGAQLSFVVIGVIAAFGPGVARWMKAWIHPDPFLPREVWPVRWCWGLAAWGWLAQMLAVSLVAAVGSSPLTLWHFQLATPVSLAANLVHVPLAGLILATAGLSAFFHPWWPALAATFNNANLIFAHCCLITAGWFSQIPGGSVLWNPRSLGDPSAACRITVFDVDGGGATLIRTPQGRAWLVDTGRTGAFRGIVLPGLTFQAVKRLDGLILSHGDSDHVGGAGEALVRLDPQLLGLPPLESRSPSLRAAVERGAGVARPLVAGDVVALDAVTTLTVLWPPAAANAPLADDGCLVLLLQCAGRAVLLSNDAGFLAERAISRSHPGLRADVWVRGRHASDLFGQEDFLARLGPSVVVCAGGDGPVSARLPAAWRTQAEAGGARVCDQAETGAVELVIHRDGSLESREFLGGP